MDYAMISQIGHETSTYQNKTTNAQRSNILLSYVAIH
jgi:hypothetical protein